MERIDQKQFFGGSTVESHAYFPEIPEDYAYADGNTLTDGRWNYTWDGENRLIGMETYTTAPTAAKRRLELANPVTGHI